jgi:hypothetical protein
MCWHRTGAPWLEGLCYVLYGREYKNVAKGDTVGTMPCGKSPPPENHHTTYNFIMFPCSDGLHIGLGWGLQTQTMSVLINWSPSFYVPIPIVERTHMDSESNEWSFNTNLWSKWPWLLIRSCLLRMTSRKWHHGSYSHPPCK